MRSVFEVIRVTEIDETDVIISSVTSSSNSRVYVGTNNGTLMVYALRHRDGDVRFFRTSKRRRFDSSLASLTSLFSLRLHTIHPINVTLMVYALRHRDGDVGSKKTSKRRRFFVLTNFNLRIKYRR